MDNIEKTIVELENTPVDESIEVFVDTQFVKNLPEVLNNLDRVKEWVERQTEHDRSLVVTSDNEEAVKARCAELNKLTEQIETKRKEVKKAYQAPLVVFENKCKAVVAALQEPKDHLWAQIKAADERRKNEKRNVLVDYYVNITGDNYAYRPFETIEQASWLTKTARVENTYKVLDEIADSIRADISAIESVGGDDCAALLVEYKRGKSVTEVLKFYEVLKAQRELQEERQRQREAQKAQTSVRAAGTDAEEREQEETVYNVTLNLRLTKAQAAALAQWLRDNSIYYTRQQ